MSDDPKYPGVHIEEISTRARTIEGAATSVTAFVGSASRGPVCDPRTVRSFSEFETAFGNAHAEHGLHGAVDDFFANGGREARIVRIANGSTSEEDRYRTGLEALKAAEPFNILCLPPDAADGDIDRRSLQAAARLCRDHRAFLVVDPRSDWASHEDVLDARKGLVSLGLSGDVTRNAAVYFPRIEKALPEHKKGAIQRVAPCGAVAGVIARTDAERGVWTSPAGEQATIENVHGLSVELTDAENELLNAQGVNCLRNIASERVGPVVWGARTLYANEANANEWRYVAVRRLVLFIEASVQAGTQWAVFEPNDDRLWAAIREHVGAFMDRLWREGAFAASRPGDAYFVRCDAETTGESDQPSGILNILIGLAPLRPAEFVIVRLQQKVQAE